MNTSEYRELARAAEAALNWRMAVVYWRRALDAYKDNGGQLARADKERMITAINADKQTLLSFCPVCGGDMHGILCPDDITRPYCPACDRTYTPIGYDSEYDYAKKWGATSWKNGEHREIIEARA